MELVILYRDCPHPPDSRHLGARPSGQLRCSQALPAPAVGTFPRFAGEGKARDISLKSFLRLRGNIGRIADVCSGAARRASHRDVASTRWRQPEGGSLCEGLNGLLLQRRCSQSKTILFRSVPQPRAIADAAISFSCRPNSPIFPSHPLRACSPQSRSSLDKR